MGGITEHGVGVHTHCAVCGGNAFAVIRVGQTVELMTLDCGNGCEATEAQAAELLNELGFSEPRR